VPLGRGMISSGLHQLFGAYFPRMGQEGRAWLRQACRFTGL